MKLIKTFITKWREINKPLILGTPGSGTHYYRNPIHIPEFKNDCEHYREGNCNHINNDSKYCCATNCPLTRQAVDDDFIAVGMDPKINDGNYIV